MRSEWQVTDTGNDSREQMARLPVMALGAGFDLLSGIRVLDLTTSVAGPYATQLLADMGAEVVKLERAGSGDDARGWGPPFLDGESLWFLSVNRNKRSIAVDLAQPAGRAIFEDLLRVSDVLVLNQPPRTAAKLGLDQETIRTIRPEIVYVSITGYGLTGEYADRTCYDLIAEGYSGIMDLTGDADGQPQKIGAPAADMLAGQDAAFAALAALLDRGRTGRGHVIDISLIESMTRFLSCRIVPYLGSGMPPRRSGGKDSVIAIYQTFETADEPITLALGNNAIWKRFWEAVGLPERASTPRFATNELRHAHRKEIVEEIQAILITRPRKHWLDLSASARFPAGPINRVEDVVGEQFLLDRQLFYTVKEGNRQVPQVGTGIRIDGSFPIPRKMPPRLGEDTRSVLREILSYDDEQIADLTLRGAVHDLQEAK